MVWDFSIEAAGIDVTDAYYRVFGSFPAFICKSGIPIIC